MLGILGSALAASIPDLVGWGLGKLKNTRAKSMFHSMAKNPVIRKVASETVRQVGQILPPPHPPIPIQGGLTPMDNENDDYE